MHWYHVQNKHPGCKAKDCVSRILGIVMTINTLIIAADH